MSDNETKTRITLTAVHIIDKIRDYTVYSIRLASEVKLPDFHVRTILIKNWFTGVSCIGICEDQRLTYFIFLFTLKDSFLDKNQ